MEQRKARMVRGLTFWSLAAVLLLGAGCSSAGGGVPTGQSGQGRTGQALSGSASTPSAITIASLPHSKCVLHHGSDSMPVWADDVGIVHLWAPQTPTPDEYTLDCDESGNNVEYQYDLSDPATFTPATPRVAPPAYATRAALADPTSLSEAALIQAGYPPRPDPTKASALYQQWLKIVSTPATIVPANLVQRTDHRNDPVTPTTSYRWCGGALDKASTRYDFVYGTYHVPFYAIPYGTPYAYATPWVGLGGVTDSGLIQDGTDIEAVGVTITQQAWYEYYPNYPVDNTNMVITANNIMYLEAWEGDSSCVHGAGHTGYGCFWYEDYSTGVTAGTFKVKAPTGSTFAGQSAEGIMEKWPQPYELAPWYGTAETTFFAEDSNGNLHTLESDPYLNVTLINGSDQTLCTASAINSDTVGQVWHQGE